LLPVAIEAARCQGVTGSRAVAERLLCSSTKISRMETGQRGASQRDVRDLCQIYGVEDPARYEHLMELSRQGRGQAWWQPYNLPYATFIGLETEAIAISDFEPGVVPGLLQTSEYARAVHERTFTRLTPALIEQRLEARRNRQQVLTRSGPPLLHTIIDEAVLHRAIGGPVVMATQLEHVVKASVELPNLTVQVLPYSVGAHPALDSTFIVLKMAAPVPSVVYVEGLLGSIYLERPEDVERYDQVFEQLKEISLSPEDSIIAIERVKTSYSSQALTELQITGR
jgi:hypothetical protein